MSLYLNFRGTFTNFGGHTKSFKTLPVKLNRYLEFLFIILFKFELDVKLNGYPQILFIILFKFELDVDSFGLRRGVDDSKVVSAIALVLNSPANLLFLY